MARQWRSGNKYEEKKETQTVEAFIKPEMKEECFMVAQRLPVNTFTRIRMLPELTEVDGVWDEGCAINPSGDPEDLLGPTFFKAEMASVYKDGTRTEFFGNVNIPEDETKIGGWSATKTCLIQLRRKLGEQHYRLKRGMPISEDIPEDWLRWAEVNPKEMPHGEHPRLRAIEAPFLKRLIQCFVSVEASVSFGDGRWKEGVGVLALPASAYTVFEGHIKQRINPGEDLSPSNCMFGDYCSLAGGSLMQMDVFSPPIEPGKKADPKQVKYSLSLVPNSVTPFRSEDVQGFWKPWEEILDLPTSYEEDVLRLGKILGNKEVGFGLRGSVYQRFVPEEWLELAKDIAPGLKKEEMDALQRTGTTPAQAAAPVIPSNFQPTTPAPAPSPSAAPAPAPTQAPPVATTPAPAPVPQAPPVATMPTQAPPAAAAVTPPPAAPVPTPQEPDKFEQILSAQAKQLQDAAAAAAEGTS